MHLDIRTIGLAFNALITEYLVVLVRFDSSATLHLSAGLLSALRAFTSWQTDGSIEILALA